jgi:uncharacterized repeat protein (TIGR03847 family)
MSRRVFSFDPPDRFVCGTVGQPGQRTFYLQASKGQQVVSVALEKEQVAVLAERLAVLLMALRDGGLELDELDELAPAGQAQLRALQQPVIEHFRVGVLSLGWDAERERVVIEAREITDDEAEEVAEEELASAVLGANDDGDGPDLVRVVLEPADAHAFAGAAVAVVQAGRPPCPLCGAPLDAGGHFCPRRNGYAH